AGAVADHPGAAQRHADPVGGDLEDPGVGLADAGGLRDDPVRDVPVQPGLDDDGLLHAGHAVGDHHRDPAGVPGDLEGTGDQRVEPDVRDQAVPDLVDDLVDRRGQQVPDADGCGYVLVVRQAVTDGFQYPVQLGICR